MCAEDVKQLKTSVFIFIWLLQRFPKMIPVVWLPINLGRRWIACLIVARFTDTASGMIFAIVQYKFLGNTQQIRGTWNSIVLYAYNYTKYKLFKICTMPQVLKSINCRNRVTCHNCYKSNGNRVTCHFSYQVLGNIGDSNRGDLWQHGKLSFSVISPHIAHTE